jgi:hypothetical protein
MGKLDMMIGSAIIDAERSALGVQPVDAEYSQIYIAPSRQKYLIPFALIGSFDVCVVDANGYQIEVSQAIKDAYLKAVAEGTPHQSPEVESFEFPPVTKNKDGTERPTAIAVDFDGCLASNAWPGIGGPNLSLIESLKKFKQLGGELILWTCREGSELDNAVNWCWGLYGLKFDALNENLPSWKAMFGNDTRKLGADYYIDDKAICVKAGD